MIIQGLQIHFHLVLTRIKRKKKTWYLLPVSHVGEAAPRDQFVPVTCCSQHRNTVCWYLVTPNQAQCSVLNLLTALGKFWAKHNAGTFSALTWLGHFLENPDSLEPSRKVCGAWVKSWASILVFFSVFVFGFWATANHAQGLHLVLRSGILAILKGPWGMPGIESWSVLCKALLL